MGEDGELSSDEDDASGDDYDDEDAVDSEDDQPQEVKTASKPVVVVLCG